MMIIHRWMNLNVKQIKNSKEYLYDEKEKKFIRKNGVLYANIDTYCVYRNSIRK